MHNINVLFFFNWKNICLQRFLLSYFYMFFQRLLWYLRAVSCAVFHDRRGAIFELWKFPITPQSVKFNSNYVGKKPKKI